MLGAGHFRDTVENALASASLSSSSVARSRVGSIFDSTRGSGAKAGAAPAWAGIGGGGAGRKSTGGGTRGWRTGAGGGALKVVKVIPPRGGGNVVTPGFCWVAGCARAGCEAGGMGPATIGGSGITGAGIDVAIGGAGGAGAKSSGGGAATCWGGTKLAATEDRDGMKAGGGEAAHDRPGSGVGDAGI